MTKHYRYGGSAMSRTSHCAAWRRLSDSVPEPPASEYAQIGTALHTVFENCLLGVPEVTLETLVKHACTYIGLTVNDILITGDHINYKIKPALWAFMNVCEQFGITEYDCEVEVSLSETVGGTLDLIAKGEKGGQEYTIIGDLKTGDGQMVSPYENAQLFFYAANAITSPDTCEIFTPDSSVIFAIIQPSFRKENTLEVWKTSQDAVLEFRTDMMGAIDRAENCDEDPVPGTWCKWCPAASICPAKTGLMEKVKRLPDDSWQMQRIATALRVTDEMEDWIRAVREIAYEQVKQGVTIPGYKLVNKRAIRIWTDTDCVDDIARASRKLKLAECYESTLLSPAKMQKLCKSKSIPFTRFEGLITAHSSGTILVDDTDPRPSALPIERLKHIAT